MYNVYCTYYLVPKYSSLAYINFLYALYKYGEFSDKISVKILLC